MIIRECIFLVAGSRTVRIPMVWTPPVDTVHLGSLNQCEGNGHGFVDTQETGKHPVFPAMGHWLDCSLRSVFIQFQNAAVEIGRVLGNRLSAYARSFRGACEASNSGTGIAVQCTEMCSKPL